VFILVLTAGCSVDKTSKNLIDKPGNKYVLELDKHIQIRVDSTTNTQKYVQLINVNDTEYLVAYQPGEKVTEFHIFDFTEGLLVSKIAYLKDGPNGFGNINSFATFYSFSRILLSQVNSNIFFLTDSSGQVLRNIDLSVKVKENIYPMASFPAIIQGNNLYSFILQNYNPSFNSNTSPEIIYNLETGTITFSPIRYPNYPKSFSNSIEVWKSSRCLGPDGSFVYSFAFDNNLYELKEGSIIKHYIPNSHFDPHLEPGNIDLADMGDQMRFIAKKGLYTYLFYDSYRHLYYRVFLMPGEPTDPDGKIIMNTERSFKIELINEDFELVGETVFEGTKYNPYRIMISKQGLVLGKGSYLNPISDEYYDFQIFRIRNLNL
jgi:hypothetical protein